MGARSAARISARTLPRDLAPSLVTARTSAMPSGRFPSRNDNLSDRLRAVPSRPAFCPPIAKHLILILIL
jgi:hypothetical protein